MNSVFFSRRRRRRAQRRTLAAAVALATTTRAWEKTPITACLWEATLPSALFREEHAHGYGSGRVKWHSLKRRKRIVEIKEFFSNVDTEGQSVVCDVIFWQDEDWYHPKDYFTTFKKELAATPDALARIVTGWVSERGLRTDVIYENYNFVWYPLPGDEYSNVVPLPLGVSAPEAVHVEPHALGEFDFLFNYLASLETAPIRQVWYDDSLALTAKLDDVVERKHYCAFVRSHSKWQDPASYEQDADVSLENCTCSNLKQCNPSTLGTLTAAQFQSILRKSAFTLSPPGHNYHSFRTWEAASASSIPVLMDPAKASDATTRGESYFFANGPFVYAEEPSQALDEMLALAADPEKLAARRQQVHEWYDRHMYMGVRRVEATVTAAAAIADVAYGPPQSSQKPRYTTEVGQDRYSTSKRNAVALTLDSTHADLLLASFRESWGVQASRDLAEPVRDDGALSVGWAYAAFAEYSTPFSKALHATITKPINAGVHFAPVVLFARDPLQYVPELASVLDGEGENESSDDSALFLAKVREITSPEENSLKIAAHYWTQWTKRAFELSTFEFQLEAFDPIAALQALGMARHPALMLAERHPFHLNTTTHERLAWDDLAAVLDPSEIDAMAAMAHALGYSTPVH